jgi:hypothetical protein
MRITKKKSKQRNRRNTKNVRNRRRINKSIKYGGMEQLEEDILRVSSVEDYPSNITITIRIEDNTTDIEVNRKDKVSTAICNVLKLTQDQRIEVLLGGFREIDVDDSFENNSIENDAQLTVKVLTVTLNIYLSVGMGFGSGIRVFRYHIKLINVPINTDLMRSDFLKINGWPLRELLVEANEIPKGDTNETLPTELDLIDKDEFDELCCWVYYVDDSTPLYTTTENNPQEIIYIAQGVTTGRTKGYGVLRDIEEITLDYEDKTDELK